MELRRFFAAVALAIAAQLVLSWAMAVPPGKRAPRKTTVPPPKWDARALQPYFEDVLKEVGPGAPGGVQAAKPAAAPSQSVTPSSAAAEGGFAWSRLIDAEALETEVKTTVNSLAPAVESPGRFKSQHYQQARQSYSLLAALFGMISAYDGDVKWKPSAAAMRDHLARTGFNCKAGTDQTYADAKRRYEDLQALLRGSSVELAPIEPASDWAKTADLTQLMKRMEEAGQKRLAPWTASEPEFKANREKVLHEAQLLAALSQIIAHESYDSGGDEVYLKHAADLQRAALGIVDAARLGDAQRARLATSQMAKACANCHTDFR